MPSLLSRYDHYVPRQSIILPVILLATSILACIGTPVPHSLRTSAIAWAVVWAYAALRLRGKGNGSAQGGRTAAWAAGGLLAIAQICGRSVDGRGIWWANGLLPLAIYLFNRTINIAAEPDTPPASPEKASRPQDTATSGSRSSLAILTCSAVVAIFVAAGSNATIALGLSYAIVTALAFLLANKANTEARHARQNGGSTVIYSAHGLLTQPDGARSTGTSGTDTKAAVIRDVAAASALATGIAALSFEDFTFGGVGYRGVPGHQQWVFWNGVRGIAYAVGMVVVHVVVDGMLLVTIQTQGSFLTSFIPLSAATFSQLIVNFSLSRLWFGALCATSVYTFLDEQDLLSTGPGGRTRMRIGRILTLIAIISFAVLTVLYLRQPYETYRFRHASSSDTAGDELRTAEPPNPLAPLQFTNTHVHPVDQLVRDAEVSWLHTLDSQSKTLEAAVAEYKLRYGIPPPPNFDKWYEFAKRKNVQLIDEYDTIYHSLLPFWGLTPVTIRARAKEALGYDGNMLMGLLIRDGKVKNVEGGQEWLQQAAVGMLEQFVQYLPDMDLAFNTHDEPRVIVPHDDLTRLVKKAKMETMPAALANAAPQNSFSSKPRDVSSGERMIESKTTRFNVYAHQPVWLPSRLSCAPESTARAFDDGLAPDNLTAYALGDLGFVYNRTAFTDVCNSPSFSRSHGFFDRPNAFNVVHDLFPIFSQSKMSCFNDIIYPSPWYWAARVDYERKRDMDWKAKIPSLFWRGSTTGGFSRDGGWRRQHRQQMVTKMNGLDKVHIMKDASKDGGEGELPDWTVKEVAREDFAGAMDVHFSHIGQCDPGDCHAQKEFFGISDGVAQQDHWKWRYLLDMDGNAFSGRFYAFLRSKSLVFKMAVFREWHEEWIRPWVHYVPLSLRGEEVLETVRYFSSEQEGKNAAVRLAEQGSEWAGKALRNEDFEVWFFRLLLEYGRLVDDNREQIGYSGS